jgi:acyl-CoA thioesterase-1
MHSLFKKIFDRSEHQATPMLMMGASTTYLATYLATYSATDSPTGPAHAAAPQIRSSSAQTHLLAPAFRRRWMRTMSAIGLSMALSLGGALNAPNALAAPAAALPASGADTRSTPSHTILVLGDSLSAEYGLPRDTGWVHLLSQRLQQTSSHYSVSNASISGDTTSSGLSRLPALLSRLQPSVVIVELGSNDALRGIPLSTTQRNLEGIITLARAQDARVLLVGMQIPPNYGQRYTAAFARLFPALATRYQAGLVPFLLDGIADKPELFQADQMHPLPKAQPVLLDNVWKPLQAFIHATPSGGR